MSKKPTENQMDLLRQINVFGRYGARSKDIGPATRDDDKIRQSCRKSGWVVCENRGLGRRWHITPRGVEALMENDQC